MPDCEGQFELSADTYGKDSIPPLGFRLCVIFDFGAGGFIFEWWSRTEERIVARGWLRPSAASRSRLFALDWVMDNAGAPGPNGCGSHSSSVRALVNRLRKLLPVADGSVQCVMLPDVDIGPAKAGEQYAVTIPPGQDAWKWLERQVVQFVRTLESELPAGEDPKNRDNLALRFVAAALLGVPVEFGDLLKKCTWAAPSSSLFDLRVTFDQIQ